MVGPYDLPTEGWTLGIMSFDRVPASLLTVFVGVTLGGWSDAMHYARDARGAAAAWFFMLLILLAWAFCMPVFTPNPSIQRP